MASTPQYAGTPFVQSGITIAADASLSAPAINAVGIIATAPAGGARIDNIDILSQGTSVAGILRLWICEGDIGVVITSITSASTTATVTTAETHGLVTGNLVTIWGAFPVEYNIKTVSITVVSPTVFTYVIPVGTGNVAAKRVGYYSSTNTNPVYSLIREVPIQAAVAAAGTAAWTASLSSMCNAELLPIVLPAGHSLRASVSVTQTSAIRLVARGGTF